MKRDDPIRMKLRAERDRAQLWLTVLTKGIGHALADSWHDSVDDVRFIVDRVNTELAAAVEALDKADAAYRPYWSSRRVSRLHRVAAPTKKAKAKAKKKAA